MLLLALALHGATVAAPPAAQSHTVTRARRGRAKLSRTVTRRPVKLSVVTACDLASDCGSATASPRDRLLGAGEAPVDPKLEMVRSKGASCGLVGMPVCPANGRAVVRVGY